MSVCANRYSVINNQSSSASSTLAFKFRFSTPLLALASDEVVTGFETVGSGPFDLTAEAVFAFALPFASFAALAAFFSLRLRFLSCT